MKRLILLGPLVTLLIAGGVWFGLPVYAENQFKAALDAHMASRNDPRVSYSGAQLDYWNNTATISGLTDIVTPPGLPDAGPMLLTVKDVSISGYDPTGFSGSGKLADHIGWSGFTAVSTDGALSIEGKKGEIKGLAAEAYNPNSPLPFRGATVGSVAQSDLTAGFAADGIAAKASVASFSGAGITEKSFDEVLIGLTSWHAEVENPDTPDTPTKFAGGWSETSMLGLQRGTPTTLEKASQKGLYFTMSPIGPQRPELKGMLQQIELSFDTYEFDGLRFDESAFVLYSKILPLIGIDPGNETLTVHRKAQIADTVEAIVRFVERAESLNTGARLIRATGIEMDMGEVIKQSVASISVEGIEGLRVAKMEMLDQKQSMATGEKVSMARATTLDMDMSGLPGFLRKLLGSEVTVESLEGLGSRLKQLAISEMIPPMDFGKTDYVDYVIETGGDKVIRIDRIATDAFKADDKGNVDLAFAMEGLRSEAGSLLGADPRGRQARAVLESAGINELALNMDVSLSMKTGAGILDVQSFGIAEQTLGDISISGQFAGIDVEKWRHLSRDEFRAALPNAVVDDVKLTVTDRKLRDLTFMLMSGGRATLDQMAQALAQQAVQVGAGLGTERAAQLGQTIAGFVREGGTLSLTTENAPPVPIIQLMLVQQSRGPAALLDLLQIEATHSAP